MMGLQHMCLNFLKTDNKYLIQDIKIMQTINNFDTPYIALGCTKQLL